MKKFILALCAVMLLMLSCTALADVFVGGHPFSPDHPETSYLVFQEYGPDIVDANDNWTVKVQSGYPTVITLRNFDTTIEALPQRSLTPYGGYIYSDHDDVNLVLEGSNRIEAKTWNGPVLGIDGNLTVSGSGSLEIVQNTNAGWGNGVSFGAITVNGKIAMNSGSIDVSFSEDVDNFSPKERGTGILARDIDMQGGKMRAEGKDYGILTYGGDINVSGGRMEGIVVDNEYGIGIISMSESAIELTSLNAGARSSEIIGGLINANGMNIYSLDGGQNAGKIGTIGGENFRASAVFAMNEDVETGFPAHHALITEPVPATGDEANLILWVGMLVVAGFALIYMKKRYA